MKIKLLKMHIQNFKGCKDREITFGDRTSIKGANATGKTTVFDAFTWMLFGKDSLGNAKFDIRPLDADGNMINNLEISVEATIQIDYPDDAAEYILKKTQKQVWRKKRGTDTTEFQGNVNEFEFNGYPKSEKEFKAFIAGIIDENIFNLVTNPNAFNALPWKEQREILMKFVGVMSDAEIALTYGDKYSLLIPELKIASTDDILKKYTKAKNTLNKQMTEIPARIDELSKQIVSVDVGALEVQKAAKQAELKRLEDSLSGGDSAKQKINDLNGRIMDEKLKISGIQNDANAELDEKRRKARQAVNVADDKVTKTEREILDAEYLKEDYIKARDRAEADKTRYAEEWKEWKKKTFPEFEPLEEYAEPLPLTDKDLTCPTCGQALPEDVRKQRIADYEKRREKAKADYDARCEAHKSKYEKDKADFEDRRKQMMSDITVKGQKAADDVRVYQKQIDEQDKEVSALKLRLECEKADLLKAKKDLDDIPAYAEISDNADYIKAQEAIQSLEAQIEELRKKTPDNAEAEARREILRDEISDIEAQIKAADNTKVKERIAELEEEQKSIGQKIAEQEQMIDLTESFIRAKMNMISEKINEKFGGNVTFKLFETQINNGIKETCECQWNGKSDMSNGEKIVAGLYIIKALSELYDVSCPVFVDNSENISTNNFPEMDTQLIKLEVISPFYIDENGKICYVKDYSELDGKALADDGHFRVESEVFSDDNN